MTEQPFHEIPGGGEMFFQKVYEEWSGLEDEFKDLKLDPVPEDAQVLGTLPVEVMRLYWIVVRLGKKVDDLAKAVKHRAVDLGSNFKDMMNDPELKQAAIAHRCACEQHSAVNNLFWASAYESITPLADTSGEVSVCEGGVVIFTPRPQLMDFLFRGIN